MNRHDRIALIGTYRTGRIESEAPRSSFSQKRLFYVKFDSTDARTGRDYGHHSEDELMVIVEPAGKVLR